MRTPEAECWLHPDVEVRPSPIAGRGLFAAVPIAAGTVVSRLGGRLVDTATLRELMDLSEEYVDTIVVAEDVHLVLAPGSDSRFGNHGCDPNLGFADEYTLVTLGGVAAGEELLVDYAMSTTDPDWFLRCHCPSYRCRQMVEGSDWQIPQLQTRYAGHWVPYIQRLITAQKKSQA
ncbi:MAG TPA: SET domain-containing protein-lysine N-methyltransferase [Nocardioides sp.]|uniref:SET domain-containing protein n=1 Tax=Nocardioides sp. TaxID=35761 RepID=UPI002E3439A9|nr:SET domain-containing protein-lysine N-methyltransferase [Nocardioides sp.]HEX5086594.1 SET domain-containing protein-lysine N-methyltransferase [Nocardioides sp.]